MVSARTRHGKDPDDPGRPDEEGLPRDRPRGILQRIFSGLLSYGVVILIMWFLINKLTSSSETANALSSITAAQVIVIGLLGLLNIATNMPPILITLPGLRFREATVTNTASSALSNTVPEGGAIATGLNFAMLRSWGFNLVNITSSFLTTGIWTNLVRYGLLAIALTMMVVTGDSEPVWIWAAAVVSILVGGAIVILILILRSDGFARALGRLLGRLANPLLRLIRRPQLSDVDERMSAFRVELRDMLRSRWHALTLAMIASQLSACLVLGVAIRMQGIDLAEISWWRIITAYGASSLASLIAPTPGGIGVVEVSLLAVLGPAIPDSSTSALLAAITLYRMATWLLPIPIGAGCYFFWRKTTRWRCTEEERLARSGGQAAVPAAS